MYMYNSKNKSLYIYILYKRSIYIYIYLYLQYVLYILYVLYYMYTLTLYSHLHSPASLRSSVKRPEHKAPSCFTVSGMCSTPLLESCSYLWNTVDGRNPAPVDRQFIPLFPGFYTSQVVWDFFQQQYHSPKNLWKNNFLPKPSKVARSWELPCSRKNWFCRPRTGRVFLWWKFDGMQRLPNMETGRTHNWMRETLWGWKKISHPGMKLTRLCNLQEMK